ncbi:MAG: hypothetical protein KKC01_04710 [Gammaproteobacteria bacterium]|nr:hypothetical protein [Gammaproteobacteria bacterium]
MILRSITKHVRDQNWFAVGIDFLIVIVGVFIGIQVANWNEARLEAREEVLLVERIRADFERIEEDAERSLAYHRERAADLEVLVRSLRRGSLTVEDRLAVERALFLGPAFQTSADNSGTFRELLSSGRANLLRDKVLLNELVAYEDFLERFDVALAYFMDMASGVQQAFTSRFEYDIEASFFDNDLQLKLEQPAISSFDFDAMVADAAFHNAAEQLVFVHSLFSLWRLRISDRVERIQQMLGEASR